MYYKLILLLFLNVTEQAKKAAVVEKIIPQSAHLLPLIMIQTKDSFQPPTHVENADIYKKKPAGLGIATKFRRDNEEGEIMFFCPAKPKYEKRILYQNEKGEYFNPNCLFKKTFRKSIFNSFEELKCDRMAAPIVLQNELTVIDENGEENKVPTPCGPNGTGILYEFVYELCVPLSKKENDNENFKSFLKRHKRLPCAGFEYFKLYKYCFDHEENTTVYTEHEVISPTIFAQDEIKYDSSKIFSMMTDGFTYFGDVFEKMAEAYKGEQVINPKDKMKQSPQTLVPSKHLFFGLWKKPTYHYANVKPQNEAISKLWTEVTDLILRNSTIMIAHTHLIYTGAFKFSTNEPIEKVKLSIPDIWVCLIIQFPKGTNSTTNPKGIVFIMSNYIKHKPAERKISKFCEESSCHKTLLKRFNEKGGYIRCCPVTEEITQLYGFDKLEVPEVLYIQDLNYEGNTYFDDLDFDNPIP